MFKPTVDDASDAASPLFNLPEYRVVAVTGTTGGARRILVDNFDARGRLPVLWGGGHAGALANSPAGARCPLRPAGHGVVGEEALALPRAPSLARATSTEHTEQVPPYARVTSRLKERIVTALAGEVRCVQAVATEAGVSWPTAMRQLTVAMAAQGAHTRARPVLVHSLGIDQQRFRSVRVVAAMLADADPAERLGRELSVDATINRAHQHGTNLPGAEHGAGGTDES